MLPTILFPSVDEYREALEKYLEVHAAHFIETIGRNSWISLFEEKLLSGVSEILQLFLYKIPNFFILFFSLGLKSEASETIIPPIFGTPCLPPLENSG